MTADVLAVLAVLFVALIGVGALALLVAYAEAPIATPEAPDRSRGTQPPG